MDKKISVTRRRFTDEQGRQLLFNGLNLVCKDPALHYVHPLTAADYRRLYRSGINVLRFGVIWAGASPTPAGFSEEYFRRVKEQLLLASDAGMRFFLDFHQDLYGVSFSDGAPAWAEMTDGLPHITGDLWSDAYLISPAVNRAIAHFWANDPVSGQGLQDRFADMAAHAAGYFRGIPGLLGYDLWNEPYPGPEGAAALDAVIGLLPGTCGHLDQAEDKACLIAGLTDPEVYQKLTAALGERTMPFEADTLMPFYEKVAGKIHDADPDALFFTEPCYFTNMGAPSGLKNLSLPGQVLAPHGYDLVVDTGCDDLYDPSRVDLIFRRHKETGERLGLPVFIGEWGAFGSRPGNHRAAGQMFRILEENLWSHTYWDWSADIESLPIWRHLVRAYPMAAAGTLEAYRWDGEKLSLSYQSVPGVTEIFVPGLGQGSWAFQAAEGAVRFEPSVYPDTGHGVLSVISDSRQAVRLEIGRKA